MEDYLIEIMKKEGYRFEDGEEPTIRREISEALQENRFSIIEKENHPIGFLSWDEIDKNGKLHIYITHCVVFTRDRKNGNLLALRQFFRNLYGRGRVNFFFWNSNRRNKFFYAK